ncbi:hypothetical protein SAMN04487770_106102 [Butyrivibrio sp. ob235]|nr:hypothetical protein SAMN04487770_106102 [Butyrivibrio sp. ob235]
MDVVLKRSGETISTCFWIKKQKKVCKSVEKMKKIIIIVAFICIIGTSLLCVLVKASKEEPVLPMPDHVVVYKDGSIEHYDEGSPQFEKITKKIRVPSAEKLETMIEDETVSEAKQDYAIEYVYDTKQCLADSTFEFENVLFFLSGWCKGEAAFGNNESYESGTIVFYY